MQGLLVKVISALPKRNAKDVVGEGTGMRAIKANDIEYIENRSYKGKGNGIEFIWLGISVLFFITLMPYRGGIELYLFLIVLGVTSFGYLYHYIAPRKYFVVNRQTGKLKVPISEKKPEVWISFEEGFGYEKTAYLDDFYTSLFFQTNPEVKPGAVFSLTSFQTEDYWNFIVWYMDKNRPLPPGTAFDTYRDKDFNRRKAEGFPKPLYPSNIETPEHTPEQQAERKRIGGW